MDGQPQQDLKEARRRIRRQQQRIAEVERDNLRLTERVAQLEEENRQLQEQLEQARRTAARQAAPFRRRPEKNTPHRKKHPGRKAGHPGACRAVRERFALTA
jgi:small-conductance mechanosensitive channel